MTAYHRVSRKDVVSTHGGDGGGGLRSIARGVLEGEAAPSLPLPPARGDEQGEAAAGSRRAIVVIGDEESAPLLADMLVRAGAVEVAHTTGLDGLTARLDDCATLVVDMDTLADPWWLARRLRTRERAVGLVFVGQDVEPVEEQALALGVAELLEWDQVDGGSLLRACRRAAWRARERVRLQRLARSDPATALASPLLLRERIAAALAAARRREALCACFHLTLGRGDPPGCGEELGSRLEALATLLGARLRRADTLARLGPGEVGVLLEDLKRPEDAVTVARKLEAAAREAGFVPGFDLFAGAALGPAPGQDREGLLAAALEAAVLARREGRAFAFADPAFDRRAHALLEAATALAEDLAAGRLAAVFQPQLALHPGPHGLAAGLAWQHGSCGRLEGEALAEFAACVGLADRLAAELLEVAAAQAAAWHEAGLQAFHLAIPLPSRRTLAHLDLATPLGRILARHRPPPRSLELELTEAHLLQALDSPSLLRSLTELPVRLAVSGFGRGPAALRLLWELPLDTVRIAAAAFALPPGRNEPPAFELVRLAKAAGRRVVVEVETVDPLPALRRAGCDAVQWVRGRPGLDGAAARRWLLRGHGAEADEGAVRGRGLTHGGSPSCRPEPPRGALKKG